MSAFLLSLKFQITNFGVVDYLLQIPVACGLRRRSAATRLLGSGIRIQLKAQMFVSCVCCCIVYVAASATSWSLVQRSPTGCVSVCDLATSTMRRPRPKLGCCSKERKKKERKKERTLIFHSAHCAYNIGTSALAYFLQCGKSCVIVNLDAVTPYLVDTVKTAAFCKIKYIHYPTIFCRVSYVKLNRI
jgi:hypothetical protein